MKSKNHTSKFLNMQYRVIMRDFSRVAGIGREMTVETIYRD